MSSPERTRKHPSAVGTGKKSRRPKPKRPRTPWWQPDRLAGAILAPLIAGLACAMIITLAQHIHLR